MKKETEQITVIMPVYNVEKYLENSVRSVMNQTYRNISIICVNDGSTDSSLAILEKLATEDNRITIISQENSGQGVARNTGLKYAKTEWISFIDSDDMLREDTYEILSKVLDNDIDMIHFGIKIVLENGIKPIKNDEKYYAIKFDGKTKITDTNILNSDGSASNKLFRKSIIDKYNIHFEKILYEDFLFTNQYLAVSRNVYYIPDKLYIYLRRSNSTMSNTFKKTTRSIDHLYAANYLFEFMQKNDVIESHRTMIVKLFISSFWFAIRFATDEIIPEITKYADKIYYQYDEIRENVKRIKKHDCTIYTIKKNRTVISKLMQKVFSLRNEYFKYKQYKVMRILNIMVYKKAK